MKNTNGTKKSISEKMAEYSGKSPKECEDWLKLCLKALQSELIEKRRIEIRRFGSFEVRKLDIIPTNFKTRKKEERLTVNTVKFKKSINLLTKPFEL